ncbi:hypothetical protein [Halorubellus salinus]|uniref:hypothetical protein n=1 Tax=Halorubellus salinus TaxID=755309 RepID=UPI001D0666EF|nr:hypothetical protein [Halorubellus salinus]
MNENDVYADIQPDDTTDAGVAVENLLAKRRRELEWQIEREREAHIRELMRATESAFVGETDTDPDELLDEIQRALDADERVADVLAPGYSGLKDKYKLLYRRFASQRERAREDDDLGEWPRRQEFEVYVRVSIALGTQHSATDKTRMAPVQMSKLQVKGARSPVDGEPTPIGRVRVSASSTSKLEKRATEIEHVDCEHILIIANPREGKDALLCAIAGNLKDEHGYKWVSLHDDGRNETPMVACPNDEDAIKESLSQFNQTPTGYPTKVYVPAVGLPDELPKNHVPFTIGVDSLTPEIVTQLSGVKQEGETQDRIKHALERCAGNVDELIRLLEKYAEETTAEVTVTEAVEGSEASAESHTRTYEMGEDQVLEDCAKSLMLLASEGLLADAGAETNLEMREVLADQEHVAVLNSNFLPDGEEHLKYLIENVWLRLISYERDEHPNLPRVAVGLREIKELAPSTLNRTKYSHIVKSLRQTLLTLSSQGGSRRILLIGSTQYLRDVYLPIRGNMPIKVLLKMGEEKISVLENAGFDFSYEQRQQLKSFPTGWGMLMEPEGKTYPINWRGPRCALGLGDMEWLDRYGLAMGFRVQHGATSTAERWHHDAEEFVDQDGVRRDAPPERQEWYLLPSDLEALGVEVDGDVSEEALLDVLKERREHDVPEDLRLAPVKAANEQREIQLMSTSEAEEREENEVLTKHGIDGVLRDWTNRKERTIEKMCRVLRAVRDNEVGTYQDMADLTGVGYSSIKNWAVEETQLEQAIEKEGGKYHLTPVGRRALEVSWQSVFEEL